MVLADTAMADVFPLVLQSLAAVAALLGAWRTGGLARSVPDTRLRRLQAFFLLWGAALVLDIVSALVLGARLADGSLDRESFGLLDALFWLHHGALLAGLGLAVTAHRERSEEAAAAVAPVLLWAEPALRLVEAGLLAFLLWTTVQNHRRRRNVGSLQVAIGFLLLLGATAGLLAVTSPLGPRAWWIAALQLAGVGLLAAAIPRRP